MKSSWLYLIAIAGLAVIIGGVLLVMPMVGQPPGLDLSRSKATAKGLYLAEIAPEAGVFKQGEIHSWVLTVKTADQAPVEGAKVEVDGGMPQHSHGLPTSPQVTVYLGEGRYRVEGVKFSMSGWWELRFAISAAAGADDVVFNLVL